MANQEIVIRQPEASEASDIQAIIAQGRRDTWNNFPATAMDALVESMTNGDRLDKCRQEIIEASTGNNSLFMRVAELSGKSIVGTLISVYGHRAEYSTAMPFPPEDTDRVCEVKSLYVDSEHHGKRIGSRLIQAHFKWAGQFPGVPSGLVVVADNQQAIGFYKRNGFEKIGTEFEWDPPDNQGYHWMQRPAMTPA